MSDNDETSILPKIFNTGDADTIQETAKALRKAIEVGGESGKYIADMLGTFPKDLVGLLLGDPISYARFRARAWYDKKVTEILKQRGIWGKTKPVSTSIALPLIETAQDEIREGLRELWARLIANAMDPDRASSVRRNIIETVKQFEPIDALLLEEYKKCEQEFLSHGVEKRLNAQIDEVEVSVLNLSKLGCLSENDYATRPSSSIYHRFSLNSFGREVMRACSP